MPPIPSTHHRHSIRLPGYDTSQAGAYFVTMVTQGRACLFGAVQEGEMRLNAAGKIVQWEWQHLGQRFPQVQLGSFIVMPNHIHAVIIIKNTVGATQAGQTGRNSGEGEQSNMDMSGNDGSPRVGRGQSGDGDSDGRDGASVHESPQCGDVGATQAGQTGRISAEGEQLNGDVSGNGGSPRVGRGQSVDWDSDGRDGASVYESSQRGDVGATQAGQTGRNSAEGERSNMDMSGNDGSPRVGRGQSVDGDSDGRDGATRYGADGRTGRGCSGAR